MNLKLTTNETYKIKRKRLSLVLTFALICLSIFTIPMGAYAAATDNGDGTTTISGSTTASGENSGMQIHIADHQVAYSANGYTLINSLPTSPTSVTHKGTMATPNSVPRAYGYDFSKWTTDPDGENEFIFNDDAKGRTASTISTASNATTTLYAQFTPCNKNLKVGTSASGVTDISVKVGDTTHTTGFAPESSGLTVPYNQTVTVTVTTTSGYKATWDYNDGLPNDFAPIEGTHVLTFNMPNSDVVVTVGETEAKSAIIFKPNTAGTASVPSNADDDTVTNMPAGLAGKTGQAIPANSFPTTNPTRTGYNFDGWVWHNGTSYVKVTDFSGIENKFQSTQTVYYATWTEASASLKFDPNDGTGILLDAKGGAITGTTGSKVSGMCPDAPNYTGHIFAGWYNNTGDLLGGGAANATFSNVELGPGVTIFKAMWKENTPQRTLNGADTDGSGMMIHMKPHTVSFNLNGASGSIPTIKNVVHKTKIVAPATPVRDGYEFGGWYTDAGLNNAFSFDNGVTDTAENITLYAKWTPATVKITLKKEAGISSVSATVHHKDGSSDESITSLNTEVDIKVGDTVELSATADTGFAFGSWEGLPASANGSETATPSFAMPNSKLTITAKPVVTTTTISLSYSPGTLSGTTSWTGNPGDNVTDGGSDLPTPTATDGYEFKGWYSSPKDATNGWDENTKTTKLDAKFPSADKTYYARYDAIEYTITLAGLENSDEKVGEGSVPAKYTIEEEADVVIPAYTRTGHTFAGWTWDNDKTPKDVPDTVTVTRDANTKTATIEHGKGYYGNITLTASFTKNKYSVNLNLGYGTGDLKSHAASGVTADEIDDVEYGSPVGSDPTEPTAAGGYKFLGWYELNDDKDGYKSDKEFDFVNTAITGDVDLYAKWQRLDYGITVTCSSNIDGATAANTLSITDASGTVPENYNVESDDITISAFSKSGGYTFKKWEVVQDTATGSENVALTNSDKTATIKSGSWGAVKLNGRFTLDVKYELGENHGAGATKPADTSVDYKSSLSEPAKPAAADDYDFDGWYIKGTDTKFDFDSDTVEAPMTLVARFTNVAKYKVAYKVNATSVTVKDKDNNDVSVPVSCDAITDDNEYDWDENIPLQTPKAVADGYTLAFMGWVPEKATAATTDPTLAGTSISPSALDAKYAISDVEENKSATTTPITLVPKWNLIVGASVPVNPDSVAFEVPGPPSTVTSIGGKDTDDAVSLKTTVDGLSLIGVSSVASKGAGTPSAVSALAEDLSLSLSTGKGAAFETSKFADLAIEEDGSHGMTKLASDKVQPFGSGKQIDVYFRMNLLNGKTATDIYNVLTKNVTPDGDTYTIKVANVCYTVAILHS